MVKLLGFLKHINVDLEFDLIPKKESVNMPT